MRFGGTVCVSAFCIGFCLLGGISGSYARALPPDVRSNHWAAHSVNEVVQNGVMTVQSDGQFHGEAKVTRAQVVIALTKLARALEASKWTVSKSVPVSNNAVIPELERGSWKQRPVTRYILASVLARLGDYANNGLTRAPADSADTSKSTVVPPKPKVNVPTSNPAYASLAYLVDHRMVWQGSPLLKPDSQPMVGAELSLVMTELLDGLTDRLTALGHNAQGETPDESFHQKK